MERETDEPEVVEIWPEHQQVFRVWSAMSGQWRWCGDSPAALDLTPLPGVLDILEIPQAQREEVLLDLRWIEVGAIEEIRRQRKEDLKRQQRNK